MPSTPWVEPQESNEDLQAEAAKTLHLLSSREVGCRDILQHDGLRQLLHLLKHPSTAVKNSVYSTLCMAAGFECCKAAIVQQQGALGQLVHHAQHEEPQQAAQALELICHCAQASHPCLPARTQHTQPAIICPVDCDCVPC